MNETIQEMKQYMFSDENMKTHNNYRYKFKKQYNHPTSKNKINGNEKGNGNEVLSTLQNFLEMETSTSTMTTTTMTTTMTTSTTTKDKNILSTFTPTQKDKLFWCFFIILKGYEDYEMNRTNSFANEKNFKIETVEKLKQIKEQLKELKLKRTELEEELVSKPTISLKGLTALCLLHNVSITYVYGRKYCKINSEINHATRVGVIVKNKKNEDSIKWINNNENTNLLNSNSNSNSNNEIDDYLNKVQSEYWYIENIQKPLKSPVSYSSSELQDICNKLEINTQTKNETTGKLKSKTKKQLYDEILQHV